MVKLHPIDIADLSQYRPAVQTINREVWILVWTILNEKMHENIDHNLRWIITRKIYNMVTYDDTD